MAAILSNVLLNSMSFVTSTSKYKCTLGVIKETVLEWAALPVTLLGFDMTAQMCNGGPAQDLC
jgi:hypothetical protein